LDIMICIYLLENNLHSDVCVFLTHLPYTGLLILCITVSSLSVLLHFQG
jgi:hypothetical protein